MEALVHGHDFLIKLKKRIGHKKVKTVSEACSFEKFGIEGLGSKDEISYRYFLKRELFKVSME